MTAIFDEHRKEYERLLQECREKGHKAGWVYYQMVKKYGGEIAKKVCEYDNVYEEW